MIKFKSTPYTLKSWFILRLPKEASAKLPSRGQVMVRGKINDVDFHLPLEPDGRGGHWLHADEALQKSAALKVGEPANLEIEATKDWPEPALPADVATAINNDKTAKAQWDSVTPLAHHEWLRWINSTASTETREKRIQVALSKLNNGEKRPCCFNRNMCCVPEVSKSGVLLDQKGEKVQN